MDKNIKLQFIDCPECAGRQVTPGGRDCQNCSGLGTGAFLNGHFLYWRSFMNRSTIAVRKIKRFLDIIINILALVAFLGAPASLFYWFWLQKEGDLLQSLLFWQNKDPFILMFWIFSFFGLFVVYRFDQERKRNLLIKRLKEGKWETPNNWKELKTFKHPLNVYSAFGEDAHRILEEAYMLAGKNKHGKIRVVHIMIALLSSQTIRAFFARLDVPLAGLMERLGNQLNSEKKDLKFGQDIIFSAPAQKVLVTAFADAYLNKEKNVSPLNIILPAIENDKILEEILLDLKIDQNKAQNTKLWFDINEEQVKNYRLYQKMAKFKPKTNMDRAYTAVATPILNNFGYDLTLAAKWGRLGVCVGREKEIKNIFENFISGNTGIILVGPEGVGKKTIIEGLAQEMVKEEGLPDYFKDKRLIEIDVARLISGADPAQSQERLLSILDEVNRAGNIILYIEDLENIVGISSGGEESLELSEVLANSIERKYVVCLSSVSDINYRKYIEGKAIGNAMSKVVVKEPEGDQAIRILESKSGRIEGKFKNIFFSYSAIEAAIIFSAKYIHDKYLPQKAVEVLEKTASRVSGSLGKGKKMQICTKNDVAITINEMTDIPTQDIEEKEGEKLLNLEKEIHKYMINQNEAVDIVADSLRRARVELREGKRPIASFLFMGPTGVGKTELAKTITQVYFGKKDYMTRLDMSEYQHQDSVKKVIGDPDGTKGYLTEAVRQRPFSLILLDEFEKAHPKIFDLFLQVMDDGRLTDGEGRTIDFTNSIIIATSNAGSGFIQKEMVKGTETEEIKNQLINEHLNKVMRPELINRFDGIIVFKPLSRDNVIEIAKLMLLSIGKMLKEKGIFFETTDGGTALLAEQGYDPKFGARPLRRLLQQKVENEIAIRILSGDIERRDTVIIDEKANIRIKKGQEL